MNGRKIIIVRAGSRLRIFAPYHARFLVKRIPGHRWNSTVKAWTVPADLEEDVRLILSEWAGGVSDESDTATRELLCRVCRRPMVDLGDGERTHPGCDERLAGRG